MLLARLAALATPAGFAGLATVLAGVGAVPIPEAAWAALAVLLGYGPSGWIAPGGWRRRGAELLLLPAAYALVTMGDAPLRQATVPPLLVAAAATAAWVAWPSGSARGTRILAVALALAVRAAGGVGCSGEGTWATGVALLVPAALAAAAVPLSRAAALAVAIVGGTLPLQRDPLATLLGGGTLLALLALLPRGPVMRRIGRSWLPAAATVGVLLASLAPWGGISPAMAFPGAGWAAPAVVALTAVATAVLPACLSGPAWLAATLLFGASQPPPPDRPAIVLTAASPTATLPTATGGLYLADLSLTNAATVGAGTVAARVTLGDREFSLRVGIHTAEWAHKRADVRPVVAHPLPLSVVSRPAGLGRDAFWGVAGRVMGELPAGLTPALRRADGLPAETAVVVATAGPAVPTPPRDWGLPAWLLAAAVAVALLQGISRTWHGETAWVPWAIVAAGSLFSRLAVEPHRLLGERHAVDLALAAFLAAWLPAARQWLRRGRVFLTAASFLLPLAVATPHLARPMGDEPYHLLLLESLASDFDLDVSDDADLPNHPENLPYVPPPGRFIQPPSLAALLLPGYFLLGRTGALLLLALAAAATVALLARRARALGVPASRTALLAAALLASYPLATFATQIWPEIVGALAAALSITWLAAASGGPWPVSALVVAAVWLKTRFGLALFPLAVAAWWPDASRRAAVLRLAAATGAAALAALSFAWLAFGDPLDPLGRRRLADLVPASPSQALTTLGGLAFDAASGLAFSAPLLPAVLAGVGPLWRRGGRGERAILLGAALTVAGLLANVEWRGGDSPPARYLVVLLPGLALAGAMLLVRPRRWRRLAGLLVPPTLLVSWVAVTRPHLLVNTGVGGTWFADALAVRFEAAAWELFPSFLRASAVRWAFPLAAATLALFAALLVQRRPRWGRLLAAAAPALWLLAAGALVATLHLRCDDRIEMESPHVQRQGGVLWPPAGQMSRFRFANGWAIGTGEAVEVPVRVAPGATYAVAGYLLERAVAGATLDVRWDGGQPQRLTVAGAAPGVLPLPAPPGPGRHRLRLAYAGPSGGFAMLDAVVRRE